MREKILELRNKGLSYGQIVDQLGCSKSTVSYHLNADVRKRCKERCEKRLSRKLEKKIDSFKTRLRAKTHGFGKGSKRNNKSENLFGYKDIIEKFGQITKCYLTGRKIDLYADEYHLDHLIPVSKGGDNSINNVGITCREANLAKSDLLLPEFLSLCKEVLEYNGYKVTKN